MLATDLISEKKKTVSLDPAHLATSIILELRDLQTSWSFWRTWQLLRTMQLSSPTRREEQQRLARVPRADNYLCMQLLFLFNSATLSVITSANLIPLNIQVLEMLFIKAQ